MIKKTVVEAIRLELDDCDNIGIYVLKAGDHPLYVGMTRRHISWRLAEHLEPGKKIYRYIRRCAPQSWQWHFELYTREEAAGLVGLRPAADLKLIEMRMIGALRPSLNRSNNPNARALPAAIRKRYRKAILDYDVTVSDFVPLGD